MRILFVREVIVKDMDGECSICLCHLTDPVRLETGFVYDRHCIAR